MVFVSSLVHAVKNMLPESSLIPEKIRLISSDEENMFVYWLTLF